VVPEDHPAKTCAEEVTVFPWIWWWSPTVHLPWSGNVTQAIEPDTDWFFGAIPASAGDGRIEQQAFELASYGRQLGLITEVLLGLCAERAPADAQAQSALADLRDIAARIEALKQRTRAADEARLISDLRALLAARPEAAARVHAALAGPAA
jgi:hypothetical protein